MVTKAQETASANLSAELKKLQAGFYEDWVEGSLPKIWNEIPILHPKLPDKVEVTLTLDEDMVVWFRKLGRGYQARINSILRVYWHALLSGQIKAHWDAEAVAPHENSLLEDMLAMKLREIEDGSMGDVSDAQQALMETELSEGLRVIRALSQQELEEE